MPEYLITIIRSIIAFILLLVMARIMGKKQVSQLTFFDYCVGITIGSIAASMAVDQNIKITNGLVSLVIWGIIPIIIGMLGLKSPVIMRITDGKSDVVIENGKILEKNLKKNQLAVRELMVMLREKNIFNIADVEMAVFETNGQLSVLKKSEELPITPRTLGTIVERDHGPTIVISDGKVMEKSLQKLGYTKEWLLGEIQAQGAEDFEDVFLSQVDSMGNVYVDLYSDDLKLEVVKPRPLVASTLKKLQADLESFSLQTENQEAKQMYEKQAQNLQNVIDNISPYLK
ncbi:DUF421 domain-containing protein [Ornithinibacillus bavariensis]|uniref:DUF421 domain-containing protein n=1 Tax=Ornithinibacillus bavariensis TaxID=545502 RepID=A0A919X5H4_9BACI|nr:DUF421 domain-containing protein [Ornithinibacillus bavariensis]GIO25906.1 hypothetical protein J43TS3_05170 [Ornithinibacillus bavariensis]HAM79694.1 DUF421 domain-containing protein [Ornithinibacillus sp.]